MFSLNGVTLRCLEPADLDVLYPWSLDTTIANAAAWSRPLSRAAFKKHWEPLILEPKDNYRVFGIETDGRLVGRVELGHLDVEHRRAFLGIVIGDKSAWGRDIGKTAVRLMVDYAFSVENLEKVSAEVFSFNERSCRLFEAAGFQREGVLRQHEIHNGARQDMHVFGILRSEFFARYESTIQQAATDEPIKD